MESEIARVRRLIDNEITSMRNGLFGLASVAKHEVIEHRYDALVTYQEELSTIDGEENAKTYVCESYIRILG